ncbi:MAG: hypothetical protein J7M26_01440, partial [Armatimonadetes bacterium]|nr:hypothetical protein [Armatimonadota bacterium]
MVADLPPAAVLALWALAAPAGRRALEEWQAAVASGLVAITGDDLLAAGIPAGPAVAAGLQAARKAALNGLAPGKEEQLAIALQAARESLAQQDLGRKGATV